MKNSQILKTLLCSIWFSIAPSFADNSNETTIEAPITAYQSALSAKRLLTDIERVNDTLFAVGERGHVIFSNDGQNWQQADVPVNVLFTAIRFVDDKTGFAVGHDATLIVTKDAGRNWQIINYQPAADKPFLNLDVQGDTVVAVGAYGLFWESNDRGESWNSEFKEALLLAEDRDYLNEIKQFEPENYDSEKQFLLPHFNNITLGQYGWYLAGEGGFFALSEDKGKSWQRIETEYYGSYFAVHEIAQQKVLLAGLRGNAFEFDIANNDWQKLTTKVPATINNIYQYQANTYLFGNSGNLFVVANDRVKLHTFADGKAVLDGVVWQDKLILATEAGIKFIELQKLLKQ